MSDTVDIKNLTEKQKDALIKQLQSEKQTQQDEVDIATHASLARTLTSLASDGNKAKYRDDVKFWRDKNQWTFYVENDSDRDTYIGDLGGKGSERESVRAYIFAHSGLDLLTVTSDEDNIKSSSHLAEFLRPNGPLKRLTPEEWDTKEEEFKNIDDWENTTVSERKKKSEEHARKTDVERSRTSRSDDALRRAAKPFRPKVTSLADRIRHTFPHGVSENEIINRVRTFGGVNTYERELLIGSINEILAPEAYEFLKALDPIAPNEEHIRVEMERLAESTRK